MAQNSSPPKRDINAVLAAHDKDKEAFKKLSDGKNLPWQPITNADYDKTIELIKFVDNLRKKAS